MENNNKPVLYSKISLMIFSVFSCFFSGLLYIQNLRELRKNKLVIPMIFYSVFFPTVLSKMLISLGIPLYYSYIPINLLGGFLLIKPFWNYQIEIEDYKARSITVPVVVVLGIIGLFIALNIFSRR